MKVITFTIYIGFASRDGDSSLEFSEPNRQILNDLVDRHLGEHGATVINGSNFFGGHPEPGAVVIVIAAEDARDRVELAVGRMASSYREQADQLEVWVTTREEDLSFF